MREPYFLGINLKVSFRSWDLVPDAVKLMPLQLFGSLNPVKMHSLIESLSGSRRGYLLTSPVVGLAHTAGEAKRWVLGRIG